MTLRDLSTYPEGHLLRADVCIVGAGPAGLTIARELSGSGFSVLVLESGGRDVDPWADGLGEIESVGAPRVMDQTLVRNRVLGGSSHSWSGRAATFDEVDFSTRPWVTESGWPMPRSEIAPFFARAMPHLGIDVADNSEDAPAWKVPRRTVNPDLLVDYVWSYSHDETDRRDFMRFGPRAARAADPHVDILLNATVTQIETTPDGRRVSGLEVTGRDRLRRRVEARHTVLAAGGIENARLLLASNRITPVGVGNEHDVVGRYLADHPRGAIGFYAPADRAAAQRRFSSHRVKVDGTRVTLTPGVALSPALQLREQLLNCAIWLSGTVDAHDPITETSALLRRRTEGGLAGVRAAGARIARGLPLLADGAARYLLAGRSPVRRLSELSVQAMVEQKPDPDSRVTLGDSVDALGMRISRIDWRIGELEARTVRRAAAVFSDEMARLGLPRPELTDMVTDPDAVFHLPDVAHPSGTTRMSLDPRLGVVDQNCAVHGVDGLFVAGSSVFPTNGHGNPTQMIVALAVRLADELRGRLAAER